METKLRGVRRAAAVAAVGVMMICGGGAGEPAAAPATATAAGAGVAILNQASSWRVLYSWTLPQVQTADGVKARNFKAFREVLIYDLPGFNFLTAYPTADWTRADFDDAGWARQHFFRTSPHGEVDVRAGEPPCSPYTRQISLRGKFNVTDPAMVGDLSLNISYLGGAIVYLNGKELTRANMPAGNLEPGALAEAYPDAVTFAASGKPLNWYGNKEELSKVGDQRIRRIEKLVVPAAELRKGTNVLAVEIHSSAYPAAFMDSKNRINWAPCGLVDLSLNVASGNGIAANVVRPAGLQVWNVNPQEEVDNVFWGDPAEPLKPIQLDLPRNGVGMGQVVASSDKPIEGLKAEIGDLTGPGNGVIPAKAVRIWYGEFSGAASRGSLSGLGSLREDALEAEPPKMAAVFMPPKFPGPYLGGSVQPIAISVRVPKDAAPGAYHGILKIQTSAGPAAEVPVSVNVINWIVPDPADFTYWCGMVESPEGPAYAYNEPLWSDRTWEMVGKSFDLMSEVDSKVLFIPLAAETELGNAEGMVRFKKMDDGKAGGPADLSRVEKYLDVAVKHLGKPRYVVCALWQKADELKKDALGPTLTVVDGAGKIDTVLGPEHDTPESIALWKPVLTRIDEMLSKRGLEGTLVLGMGDDYLPKNSTVKAYQEILPKAGWYAGMHKSQPYHVGVGDVSGPIMYQVNVYGVGEVPDPSQRPFREYGWKHEIPVPGGQQVWLFRAISDSHASVLFRWEPEAMLLSDRPGEGALGADFWPPAPGKGPSRVGTMFSRYVRTQNIGAGGKGITTTQMLAAGPDGPVPTIRFEMMREGIQEAEARIFLEKLLLEKPMRLSGELAQKAQSLLDERARWARLQMTCDLYTGTVAFKTALTVPYSGWEARTRGLFEVAGEAAAEISRQPAARAVKDGRIATKVEATVATQTEMK